MVQFKREYDVKNGTWDWRHIIRLFESLLHVLRKTLDGLPSQTQGKRTYLLHLVQVMCLNSNNLPPKSLLNHFHLMPGLLVMHEVDRDSLASKATRSSYPSSNQHRIYTQPKLPTNPVDIRLDVWPLILREFVPLVQQRQVIVHHHVNLQNVDTPSNDVRGDEDLLLAFAEAVDDGVSLSCILGTVQRSDFVALGGHSL